MLAVVIAIAFAGVVLSNLSRDRMAMRYAGAALAMHVIFAFAQYWVQEVYYGVSDVHIYTYFAEPLVRALDRDFVTFAPEVLKLALHLHANLPGTGLMTDSPSSSTTMTALTAFIIYMVGRSTLAAFVVVSTYTWYGSLLLARAFEPYVHESERPLAYLSAMLVPSVVFWSSSIVKEGFVMAGLGLMCLSADKVFRLRRFGFIVGIGAGGVIIGTLKPYVLFPLVVGFAAWLVLVRQRRTGEPIRIRLVPILLAAVVAVAGVIAMGALFPDFSVENIAEQTAHQQQTWDVEGSTGSSNVEIGSGRVGSQSLVSQLPYVPLALVNTLFRPFIFEARNLTIGAAALESTVITFIVIRMLWRFPFAQIRSIVLSSPLLLSSLVFSVIFGVAVGLTTLNLGSLSRYRLPMIPFYFLGATIVSGRLSAAEAARRALAAPGAGRQRTAKARSSIAKA